MQCSVLVTMVHVRIVLVGMCQSGVRVFVPVPGSRRHRLGMIVLVMLIVGALRVRVS
jgi:hypothetical protein